LRASRLRSARLFVSRAAPTGTLAVHARRDARTAAGAVRGVVQSRSAAQDGQKSARRGHWTGERHVDDGTVVAKIRARDGDLKP
jgi:hypothetical protein